MHLSQAEIIIILSTFVILIVVLMMVIIYGVFIKKKSELLLIKQRQDAIFEQQLALSQVELQDQTLKHIGQELHDDLGQKLSVARLMTNKVLHVPDTDVKEVTDEINVLIGECLQDIRNISKAFISKQSTNFDFVESLEREVFRIKRLRLLQVHYQINHHNLSINPEHGLILFRIIQECITNVIKHSRSKSIQLLVEDQTRQIKFQVIDKGIGFKKNKSTEGIGLKNMMNRAKIINADLKVSSVENKGTQITVVYKK